MYVVFVMEAVYLMALAVYQICHVLIVLVYQMVATWKIIVGYVMMTVPMTVYKIVQVNGVENYWELELMGLEMMNVAYVVVMTALVTSHWHRMWMLLFLKMIPWHSNYLYLILIILWANWQSTLILTIIRIMSLIMLLMKNMNF